MSKIEVNTIDTIAGSTTLTLGSANATLITLDSGAKFSNVSGQNYPAFFVRRTNDQVIGTDSTYVKIEFPTEDLDTDNCFDNVTNYRFTPNVAGKYLFFASVCVIENNPDAIDAMRLEIRKNGVAALYNTSFDFSTHPILTASTFVQVIFDMNGSTDYVESYGYIESNNFSGTAEKFDNQGTFFGGYRIGA